MIMYDRMRDGMYICKNSEGAKPIIIYDIPLQKKWGGGAKSPLASPSSDAYETK